jgi:hypothetical protein
MKAIIGYHKFNNCFEVRGEFGTKDFWMMDFWMKDAASLHVIARYEAIANCTRGLAGWVTTSGTLALAGEIGLLGEGLWDKGVWNEDRCLSTMSLRGTKQSRNVKDMVMLDNHKRDACGSGENEPSIISWSS